MMGSPYPPVLDLLETARAAARAAGNVIRERYDQPRQISEKAPRDLVTDTDHAAQAAALAVIQTRHPDHRVMAEEDPTTHLVEEGRWQIPDGMLWLVDPLDGTTNFTTGLPISCVSVGAAFDGLPLAGAIYDPYRDELFTAALGQGAALNGRALPALTRVPLQRAIISADWARAPQVRHRALECIRLLAPHCHTVRVLGSAALSLAYVACGRAHLYFNFGLQPWDVAAGAALIRETGGDLRLPNDSPWQLGEPALLSAHPAILDEAIPLVSGPAE